MRTYGLGLSEYMRRLLDIGIEAVKEGKVQ
jgi:hypothetical protein